MSKFKIGVKEIEGPVVGAEFELPDEATVISAQKEPGSFTGGADLTVFYITPAAESDADAADKVAVGRDCPWCGDEVTDQADALEHLNDCPPDE